jgi:phage-related protein
MPYLVYGGWMKRGHRPTSKDVVWLHGEVKTPPFSEEARLEVGALLRRLQDGETLKMPHSSPMPTIGQGCHELRVRDENVIWRVIYRIDVDAIQVGEVFNKTTRQTPVKVINDCRERFAKADQAAAAVEKAKGKPKGKKR